MFLSLSYTTAVGRTRSRQMRDNCSFVYLFILRVHRFVYCSSAVKIVELIIVLNNYLNFKRLPVFVEIMSPEFSSWAMMLFFFRGG